MTTSTPYVAFAYDYDPHGTATLTEDSGGNGAPQTPYTFKNGTQDRSTGWIKYGARRYNPAVGRWMQQDPLDAPLDPANANRYGYEANDPINNTDPTGLITGKSFFLVTGAVGATLLGLSTLAMTPATFGGSLSIRGAVIVALSADGLIFVTC